MKKKIVTRRGGVKALTVIFKCTPQMVCAALGFRKDTPLALRIRKAALAQGGVEVNFPEENSELRVKN